MSLSIVVLAGGKGTRIKSILGNTPKILAPIGGKTFLDWFLKWVESWELGINNKIILSTGIGHQQVKNYCKKNDYDVICIDEIKPLGTFGAIANVASNFYCEDYLVLNGDTIFDANFKNLYKKYCKDTEKPMLILKESFENERYGGYKKTKQGWVFTKEKSKFISLGAFFISFENLKKRWAMKTNTPFDVNSINKKMEREMSIDSDCFGENPISAVTLKNDTYFLDIGIPSSYSKSHNGIPLFINKF